MHRQRTLFGAEEIMPEDTEDKYELKIEAPIYEPKNKPPDVFELVDRSKLAKLKRAIAESTAPPEVKDFLIIAAHRHAVFNYEKIADFYSHANQEVKTLMEESALVIVDFESAIENGFLKICDELRKQYLEEYE